MSETQPDRSGELIQAMNRLGAAVELLAKALEKLTGGGARSSLQPGDPLSALGSLIESLVTNAKRRPSR